MRYKAQNTEHDKPSKEAGTTVDTADNNGITRRQIILSLSVIPWGDRQLSSIDTFLVHLQDTIIVKLIVAAINQNRSPANTKRIKNLRGGSYPYLD